MEEFKCVLYEKYCQGFGNNPQPLAKEGKCCDSCNVSVILARLEAIKK